MDHSFFLSKILPKNSGKKKNIKVNSREVEGNKFFKSGNQCNKNGQTIEKMN